MIETDRVSVPEDSPLAGRKIGDLQIRTETGASIVAVVRGESVTANPGPGFALASGDVLSVLGTPDQRAAFSSLVRS